MIHLVQFRILHQKQYLGRYTFFFFFFVASYCLSGQKVAIDSISISGLEKTREYILIRELNFKKGDSLDLQYLASIFQTNEKRLLNTNLVVEARCNLINLNIEAQSAGVNIHCKEALYIYPAPLLEFIDNDFNKWWRNYNRSLKRLSYGLFLSDINIPGNGDRLTVYGQAGFTKKISIDYDYPYLNHSNTLGIGFTGFYAANREVAYKTIDNFLVLKRNLDQDLLKRVKLGARMFYRPAIYAKHLVEINYYHFNINDSLTTSYNPDYLNNRSKLSFPEFIYLFRYDTRDVVPYAMKGWSLGLYFSQIGLSRHDIHKSDAGLLLSGFFKITPKLSLEEHTLGRYNLDRGKVPYYFNKAIGYDDIYVRGYDLNVIDGQDYFLLKNIARYKVLGKELDWGKYMVLKAYRKMPLDVYLTGGFDIARVADRFYAYGNPLTNKYVYGYGVGLDVVFYYNKLVRLEVSRNSSRNFGFYLHFDAGL